MAKIERLVHIDGPPVHVTSALTSSEWWAAMRIEPERAGTCVVIEAFIEPDALARVVETAVLRDVCELREAYRVPADTSHQSTTTRSKNMTELQLSIDIEAPPGDVWVALADFGGISTWNPNVKQSKLTSGKTEGTGISRECNLVPMGTVQERVTDWDPGRLMHVEIYDHKGVPAFRGGSARFVLNPSGDGTTVECTMAYSVGLGAIGAGMNSMMMKRQFTKAVTGLLAGLKYHVETGEPVVKGSKLSVEAVSVR